VRGREFVFSVPNVYYLELHLRFEVVGEQGKAKFDGKRKILRVSLPVVQPTEQETGVEEGEETGPTPASTDNPIETFTPKGEEAPSDPDPAPSFLNFYQPVEEPKAESGAAEGPLPEVQIHPSSPLPDPVESLPSPSIEELPPPTPSPKPIQQLKPSTEIKEPVYVFNQDSSAVAHVLFHVPGLHLTSLHSSLYRNGFRANWISETKTETRKSDFAFQFEGLITLKGSSVTGIIDYVIVKLAKTSPEAWNVAGHFVQDFEGLAGEEEQPVEPEAPVVVSEPEVPSEPAKSSVFSYIAFETPLLYELV